MKLRSGNVTRRGNEEQSTESETGTIESQETERTSSYMGCVVEMLTKLERKREQQRRQNKEKRVKQIIEHKEERKKEKEMEEKKL